MTTANSSQSASTWDQIKDDSSRLLKSLGKVVDQLAEDFSKIMVVTIEEEERKKMDQLVNAGLVENRGEALRFLVKEGIKACQETFTRIQHTNKEIDQLKNQIGEQFSSKKNQ
jgi:Arc/MetJ-type ribon-helix-helix transcriptional regulator